MATDIKYRIVRYGLCMNDNCPKSKIKEKQHISGREEFVCKECGKPLFECPPPRSWWNKNGKSILVGIAVIIALGTVCFFVLSPKSENNVKLLVQPISEATEEIRTKTDTVMDKQLIQQKIKKEKVDVVKKTVTSVNSSSINNSLDLGYAIYKGRIKNGLPHDENGRMSFKEKYLIDKRDSQKRMAEPGDYIIGEYVDGKLVQGVWYNEKNIVKGSIIIGL